MRSASLPHHVSVPPPRTAVMISLVMGLVGPVASSEARTTDHSRLAQAHEAPAGSVIPKRRDAGHDAVVALIGPRGFMCSGVLVHERLVLTARHCLSARSVTFGESAAAPRFTRAVVRRHVPERSMLDVALLEIEPAAVKPYPLDSVSDGDAPNLRIVGFGALDFRDSRSAGVRTYFDVSSIPLRCSALERRKLGCLPGFEFALPRGTGADTCSGDSGGPVLVRTGDTWRVVGITSRAASSSVLPCGDGGVYVRVDRIHPWIQGHIHRLTHEDEQ